MHDSILDIPTVYNLPFRLKDIIYNCPICDYEIDIDIIVNEGCSIKCINCNHKILLKTRNI